MKKLFIIPIFLLSSICGYSQKNDTISNPLEKFFQDNYDSTIINEFRKGSDGNYTMFITTRKGDKLYNYKYYQYTPYGYPNEVINNSSFIDTSDIGPLKKLKFSELIKLEKYKNTKPNIKEYFYWYGTESINYDTLKNLIFNTKDDSPDYKETIKPLWLKLQKFNLWRIIEDSIKVSPFKSNGNSYIKFITKSKVMRYEFKDYNDLKKLHTTQLKIIEDYFSEIFKYFIRDI
jgi:hypothetical protein